MGDEREAIRARMLDVMVAEGCPSVCDEFAGKCADVAAALLRERDEQHAFEFGEWPYVAKSLETERDAARAELAEAREQIAALTRAARAVGFTADRLLAAHDPDDDADEIERNWWHTLRLALADLLAALAPTSQAKEVDK